MEAATGFAHEPVVGTGILHQPQVLANGISSAQGMKNRARILGGYRGVVCAEQTGEPRLDLKQESAREFNTTRPHPAHICAVKIKDLGNPGQRGHQKSGMPPEQNPTTWMVAWG